MATVIKMKAQWLYHEFGLASLLSSKIDARLIILTRALRMFAYGTNSIIIALFFNSLKFSDEQIGLFMTLTLLGDVFLSFLLTLVADGIGRRRTLMAGSILMVLSGIIFALFENYWILLAAAVVGVISPTGSEIGPFRAVEESTISHLTTSETRSDVLSWYVTIATFGSAVGSVTCGFLLDILTQHGWTTVAAYHAIFWIYALTGAINTGIMCFFSSACESEAPKSPMVESQPLMPPDSPVSPIQPTMSEKKKSRFMPAISSDSLAIVIPLTLLFMVDSLGGGMSPWSLVTYYLSTKFSVSNSDLGSIASACYLLGGISTIFAAPLARRFGLLWTMVFTHLPSSIALALIPVPNTVLPTFCLLLFRATFSSMDQAPRAAFVATVVKPEERTAVMGWNQVVRTLAQSAGPTFTGLLAGSGKFWIAFVCAGALKGTYDVGLWFWGLKLGLNGKNREQKVPQSEEDAEMAERRAVNEDED